MHRLGLVSFFCLPLVACGEPNDSVIEEVRVESDRLVVELRPGADLYYETCVTELVTLSKEDPSGGAMDLTTDIEAVANRWEGYWLDGEFQYPSFDEGCDIVMCSAVDFDPEVGRKTFEITGVDVPPEDLAELFAANPWAGEAPEQVEVVESVAIEGSIRVEVNYYLDDDCSGRTQSDSVVVEL